MRKKRSHHLKTARRKQRRLAIEVLDGRCVLSAVGPQMMDAPAPHHSFAEHAPHSDPGPRDGFRHGGPDRGFHDSGPRGDFHGFEHQGGRRPGPERDRSENDFGEMPIGSLAPATPSPIAMVTPASQVSLPMASRPQASVAISMRPPVAPQPMLRPIAVPAAESSRVDLVRSAVQPQSVLEARESLDGRSVAAQASEIEAEGGLVEIGSDHGKESLQADETASIDGKQPKRLLTLDHEPGEDARRKKQKDVRLKLFPDAALQPRRSGQAKLSDIAFDQVSEEGGMIELAQAAPEEVEASSALNARQGDFDDVEIEVDAHLGLFREVELADEDGSPDNETEAATASPDIDQPPIAAGVEESVEPTTIHPATLAGAALLMCMAERARQTRHAPGLARSLASIAILCRRLFDPTLRQAAKLRTSFC